VIAVQQAACVRICKDQTHVGGKDVVTKHRLAAKHTTAPTRGAEALQLADMHPGGQQTSSEAQGLSYEQDAILAEHLH
jgi:hypothetical protein